MDLSKYLTLYVSEAAEHLAAYGRDLVALERAVRGGGGEGREVIDSLFRRAHSVKGMSAAMELDGPAALAHRAEDLVDLFRRQVARPDEGSVDVLLAVGDALQAMVQAAGRGEKPEADAALLQRVTDQVRRLKGELVAPAPQPPLAPAGARTEPAASASPAGPSPITAEASEGRPSTGSGRAGGEGTEGRAPAASATPAKVPTHRRVEAIVEIASGCPVPAVRGFLVVKKLATVGAVARATPTVEDLKVGRIPGKKLEVLLDTAEPLATLEKLLGQISDIARVTLREPEPEPAPAPALPAPRPAPDAAAAEAARTVRVRTEILDGFLDAVGELILATARIREIGRTLPAAHRPPLEEGVDRLHGIVKDLHDKVMRVRMTPLALLTDRLPRAARDVARKVNKQVEVTVEGAEIEIDRAILEELSDPLLHVLRNSVDHGVEAPHLRLLAGKPATGRITVQARRDRDRVIVEIADDGKGMDPARLRAAALARGLVTPEAAEAMGDREALLLACLPGISTAEQVTDLSGRGVGLDAVKRAVESVGGALEMDSVPGRGTRITMRLPLTVAVQPVLLVRVGEEVLGLPIAKVHGAAQVTLSALDRTRGMPVLPYAGEIVPVRDLGRLLGFDDPSPRDERAVVLAEAGDAGRVGLAVDGLLGQQEAVLKPLGQPLENVPGLSAVTVLGNGRPVFILDVQRLLAA